MKADLKADLKADGPPRTRLGAWLAAQMRNRNLSTRDVEALSGGLVSRSTVSAITTGAARAARITPEVAAGLSRVFEVDVDDVLDMVDTQQGEPYVPPVESRYLTASQRKAVDSVIRAFVNGSEE